MFDPQRVRVSHFVVPFRCCTRLCWDPAACAGRAPSCSSCRPRRLCCSRRSQTGGSAVPPTRAFDVYPSALASCVRSLQVLQARSTRMIESCVRNMRYMRSVIEHVIRYEPRVRLPRFLRCNTLKMTVAEAASHFEALGYARVDLAATRPDNAGGSASASLCDGGGGSKVNTLDHVKPWTFGADDLVPGLFVLPPGTNLHDDAAVSRGKGRRQPARGKCSTPSYQAQLGSTQITSPIHIPALQSTSERARGAPPRPQALWCCRTGALASAHSLCARRPARPALTRARRRGTRRRTSPPSRTKARSPPLSATPSASKH